MNSHFYIYYKSKFFVITNQSYQRMKHILPQGIELSQFPLTNEQPISDFFENITYKVILLKRYEKTPLMDSWDNSMVGPECIPLLKFIRWNYAIILRNSFCCVDIDNLEVPGVNLLFERLQANAQAVVKSPRGWHFYLSNTTSLGPGRLKSQNQAYGDFIAGPRKYVVGPGSVVNGINYYISQDLRPGRDPTPDIIETLKSSLKRTKNPIKYLNNLDNLQKIFPKAKLSYTQEKPIWRIINPLHGSSKNEYNSIVNESGLYCFRCECLVPLVRVEDYLKTNTEGSWKSSCQIFLDKSSATTTLELPGSSVVPIKDFPSAESALEDLIKTKKNGIWGFYGKPGIGKTTALSQLDRITGSLIYFISFKKAILDETCMRRKSESSRHYAQHSDVIRRYSFWTLQRFIKHYSNLGKVDKSIVIVDEAHELFTEASYTANLMSMALKQLQDIAKTNLVILTTATPIGLLSNLCQGVYTITKSSGELIEVPEPIPIANKEDSLNHLFKDPNFLNLGGYIRITSINEFLFFKDVLINKGVPEKEISLVCSDNNFNLTLIKEIFLTNSLDARFVFFTKVLDTGVSLPYKPFLIGLFNLFSLQEQIQVFNRVRTNDKVKRVSLIYATGYLREYLQLGTLEKKQRHLTILKSLEVNETKKVKEAISVLSSMEESIKNVKSFVERSIREHINWAKTKEFNVMSTKKSVLFDKKLKTLPKLMEVVSYKVQEEKINEIKEEAAVKLRNYRNQFLRGLFHLADEEMIREFIPLLILAGMNFREVGKIANEKLLEVQYLKANPNFGSKVFFKRYSRNRYINCFKLLKFFPLQLNMLFQFYNLSEKKQEKIIKLLRLNTHLHDYKVGQDIFEMSSKKNSLFELILNSKDIKQVLNPHNKEYMYEDLLAIYVNNKGLFEALIREFFPYSSIDSSDAIDHKNRLKRLLPKVFELFWGVQKKRVQRVLNGKRKQPIKYSFKKFSNEDLVLREGLTLTLTKKGMVLLHAYLNKLMSIGGDIKLELAIERANKIRFDSLG